MYIRGRKSRSFDLHETSLVFADAGHAGDKRKKSQNALMCVSNVHAAFHFAKSKAMLGTVGPLNRARVMELISEDPDKPASPPARVSRRTESL